MTSRHLLRGFTLIELMIAIAVVSVLAAVALPSFADAFRKGRRAEAMSALMQLQMAQERWRADHARYTDRLADLRHHEVSTGGHYRLAIVAADAHGYVLEATAINAQAADRACQVLVLSQRGGQLNYSARDASGHLDDSGRHRCWPR